MLSKRQADTIVGKLVDRYGQARQYAQYQYVKQELPQCENVWVKSLQSYAFFSIIFANFADIITQMAKHNETGKWGEQIAVEKLIKEGYAIVERNWRLGHFEIDIVASKGNRIVFVEVKTRADDGSDPLEAIDQRKIRHMASSANAYMQATHIGLEAQFDIIGITVGPDGYSIEHIEDAFLPPLKTYN